KVFPQVVGGMLKVFRVFIELVFAVGVVQAAAIQGLVKFFLEFVGSILDPFDNALDFRFRVETPAGRAWLGGQGKRAKQNRGARRGKRQSKSKDAGFHLWFLSKLLRRSFHNFWRRILRARGQ